MGTSSSAAGADHLRRSLTQITYAGSAPFLVNGALQLNVVLPKELIPDLAVPIQLIASAYASPPGATIAVK